MQRTSNKPRPYCRSAFFILEMIVGLALLALAGFVLILATSRVHLASSAMADARQATRAAEAALSQLQAGRPTIFSDSGAEVHIHGVDEMKETESGEWVEVTATVGRQTRVLFGLVPRGAPRPASESGGKP